MWIRFSRLHRKSVLFSAIFVFTCVSFYLMSMQLVNFMVNSTRKSRQSSVRRRPGDNVIVAHYIGTGNLLGNITKDLMNGNLFAPIEGEGANGKPVVIPPRELLKMQQQFQINRFNLLASDRMPLNRSLPDYRKEMCVLKKYPRDLPTTSVIIVFHNEAWSVLMRTVWSIINRSPRHLLREILLVDDASDREFLKKSLDDYVAQLPVHTKVLRMDKREGLITARLLGAEHAAGDVLTFLDAHCECSMGWLEPLLARVNEDRKNVVCPVIDILSDDNFQYIKSFELHWGAFNWQMHFRWYLMSDVELRKRSNDSSRPFPTPAMAGGLFAINKEYFFEIGAYDPQMKIWGGENLEMSFRVWQCGGRVEIAPCSHVGHLFRKSSPYTFPGGVNEILNENLARTALVWMDDWAQFFFKYFRISKSMTDSLDVNERLALRDRLQCKSFDWYLDNVWPDNFWPSSKRFFGKILHIDDRSPLFHEYLKIIRDADAARTSDWTYVSQFLQRRVVAFKRLTYHLPLYCMKQPPSQNVLNLPLGQAFIAPCAKTNVIDEMFVIKEDGHITTNEGVCLDALESTDNDVDSVSMARIINCGETSRQLWTYNLQTQQIIQRDSRSCLTVAHDIQNAFDTISKWSSFGRRAHDIDAGDGGRDGGGNVKESKFNVSTAPCTASRRQKWMLLPLNWK